MITKRSLIGLAAHLALTSLLSTSALSQEAKIPVVASFSILGDFVAKVGGDRIILTTLVRAGSDAHVYAPTPADAKAVMAAQIVFANGLSFESWMKRLAESSASKAKLVEVSKGIRPLAEPQKHNAHHHGHSHGTKAIDPHAWQSVSNVKLYISNIRDALIAADPAGKPVYDANASRYLQELDALDAEIRTSVARIPADRRKIITSHDAFGYLGKDYGLAFIAPRGVSTEAEASAADVAKIIRQIKQQKITAVFVENISDQRLIEQIAKESGAKVGGTLYSDSLSAADGPAATYIQMMRHNIRAISEALLPKV